MAPALVEQPVAAHDLHAPREKGPSWTTNPITDNENAPRSIFPDGIRTSGQHPPLYDVLRPFADFPEHITGKTVWDAKDFISHPERWRDAPDGYIQGV
ncbi:hypothetical protein VTK73DRAFT_1738 [Phialemonium thermophilum]|uniref:Uncharacterized protein n=1 Tax=Phialemonium thermophilum TaxID=223376 RepID=A0ABR3VT25_9PEZI